MDNFLTAFLPMFIAIDVVGILPTFLNMTDGTAVEERRKIVLQAILTAFCVGVLFVFTGQYLFNFLGITMADFKVAGGILLFLFSVKDLTSGEMERRQIKDPHLGIVPIGMPLIAGPGVLTSMLLLSPSLGEGMVLSAFIINILIVLAVFWYSNFIIKVIGEAAAKATGKLFAIFLGAIGVMMIRSGIFEYFNLVVQ